MAKPLPSSTDEGTQVDRAISDVAPGGLVLNGKVLHRSARLFKSKTGEENLVTTYRILGGISIYFVDDWNPKSKMPIGAEVKDLAVEVRAFAGRGGQPQTRLVVVNEIPF